ncbi:acetyl/propionyl/methylcrotonyl-CoA carboxylase subunit alpha [Brevibacterium ihuae]|uniref:acetyl/propionyl/methylcrotonyl-CoA carboxylase subunit alpha n=1 Tax=Brevibacterium ihuae TaxID=1631743 RepID=UPI000C75ED3F|nr:biotin carboxylase N-terminal domain-containing protein [Brevibacterium ihuae]
MTLSAVLIANRGEIAVRIARAARDLGIRSIAVYSEPDADALHAAVADEAYALPGADAAETYMNVPALLEVAARTGADCVHPGYGFLSENADFARAVIDAGLTWVGPSPDTIDLLGNKVTARRLASEVGAPLAPGTDDPIEDWQTARDFAAEHGTPIAIKAAFGGGGRGLKVVHDIEDVEEAFASAGREAQAAFGRAECFVEKFLERPRHVEAQVLADTHGTTVVLGTRDCSLQRRNQKLVEEAPAPFLTPDQHARIVDGARDVCVRAGYVGAGTVEFLLAEDGTIAFLEVNTRVQVEHPVTEAVTGVDIVAEQFRIAAGEPLTVREDPEPRGHAFEFRINVEDVAHGFVPAPGTVTAFAAPTGPGIRVDSGVRSGSVVPGSYDSLIAKLVVHGPSREVALARARDALAELEISGVRTVVPFHRDVVDHPDFTGDSLDVHTGWIEAVYQPGLESAQDEAEEAYAERTRIAIEIDGRRHELVLPADVLRAAAGGAGAESGSGSGGDASSSGSGDSRTGGEGTEVTCGYAGSLVRFNVEDGAEVAAGDEIAVIEAMKMESPVTAPAAGTVALADLGPGDAVEQGQVIATITG